ncbi:hypothetical protein [Enorma phocaeensis]|uniref:hypothetical protein n=1 Tax=Enorma phocaeensis TaxID=1871019 RepID=UPI000C830436|nr:hypothetical protein [Enorma phocaeensis]
MRALKKICTIVYLLSAVVVAGGFACLQFGSEHVRNRIAELLGHPAGRIVLIVCTVVLLLGVLITALLVFAERSPLTSVHPGGNPNIEVRLAALTSVARAAAEENDVLVDRVRSRVVGRDGTRALITLEVIAFTQTGLADLGAHVQEHVTEACERMLGSPGVTVRIRFLPSKTTVIKEGSREQA